MFNEHCSLSNDEEMDESLLCERSTVADFCLQPVCEFPLRIFPLLTRKETNMFLVYLANFVWNFLKVPKFDE